LKQKEIYIAGPMSGIPEYNFPAFFAAEKRLSEQGWKVWNPAAKETENDVQADESFATGDNRKLVDNGWDFREAYLWDCKKVIYGDGIYMLKGWENSPGARGEHAVALFVKRQYPAFEIIYE
jgi:hypothetical protein